MKWSLVFAGISDIQRPIESISGTQQVALLATGAIWTRWCMIIKPKNYLLASVNFFLGTVAGYQVLRLYSYQRSLGNSVSESVRHIAFSTKANAQEDSEKAIAQGAHTVQEGKKA